MQVTNIGRMNQRVRLYKNSLTTDEMGQSVNGWELFKEVWAQVTPKSGTEPDEAGKTESKTTYTVRIRFVKGITTDMRLELKGKKLEIKSAIDLYERGRIIEMQCVENAEKGD